MSWCNLLNAYRHREEPAGRRGDPEIKTGLLRSARNDEKSISVYVHFPYCLYKCHYCDFNSYAVAIDSELFDRYLGALVRELSWRIDNEQAFPAGSPLATLFMGGGTPSLMSAKQIGRLKRAIETVYPPLPHCEFTVECNPKTLDLEKTRAYQDYGITRLSIGVQSFSDRYLAPLGRIHSGREAQDTLSLLKKSGFPNVNVDLMFGFPEQTVGEVIADLDVADGYGFAHLSFYNLTPEPKTRFYQDLKLGKIALPENDCQWEMMTAGKQFLENRGFVQYEVSNFYRLGQCPSLHNLRYWDYRPFLGLGAGAYSFFCAGQEGRDPWGRRQANTRLPELYMTQAGNGPCYEEEWILKETAMREWIMMGLRKRQGILLSDFKRLFNISLDVHFSRALRQTEERAWLIREGDSLRATEQGLWLLNDLIAEFF